jgi:hypothetical protein
MYYSKITDHKLNLVKGLISEPSRKEYFFTVFNPDNFSITELDNVDLYLFEADKYLENIRLIYLKTVVNEHWEILFTRTTKQVSRLQSGDKKELQLYKNLKEKNDPINLSEKWVTYVEISKKIVNVQIPTNLNERVSELNRSKHLPLYLRIAPDFTLEHYNEFEALNICNVEHIKNLLCFSHVNNIDHLRLINNVFNQDNSGSVKIKYLDNGNIEQAEYNLFERNEKNLKKADTYKNLIENLFNGEIIFRSKFIAIEFIHYFRNITRYLIVYKDGMYYALTLKSYTDNTMTLPEYSYTIDALTSKSFDSVWDSLDNKIKCKILTLNYKSALGKR